MTERIRGLRQLAATATFLLAYFILAGSLCGQGNPTESQGALTKPLTYDVVSIRPNKSGGYTRWRTLPNGASMTNITAFQLFWFAYAIQMEDQIAGLPGWARTEQFDIEAKMDDEVLAALQKLPDKEQQHQRQLMQQAILAERFKLKVHHEIKEQPIYDLVIAKGGRKFKESPPSEAQRMTAGGNRIMVQGMSLDNLVGNLSGTTGRLVIDETGLTGNYDFELKWTPDDQQGAADAGPTLFTALEEQLGLKLVPAKGPVDVFVIDHVERPSAN